MRQPANAAEIASQLSWRRPSPAKAPRRNTGALRIEDALGELTGCQLIIEAVFEDMAVKARRPGPARAHCGSGNAVIATNTSYLDVNRLAEASGRPQDIIGLHFFAPAEIMRLVEVVRGGKSAPDAVATGLAIARRLGKLPVVAGVCDGFIGNRILSVYRARWNMHLKMAHCRGRLMQHSKLTVSPWGLSRSRISPGSTSPGRGESGWPTPALLRERYVRGCRQAV